MPAPQAGRRRFESGRPLLTATIRRKRCCSCRITPRWPLSWQGCQLIWGQGWQPQSSTKPSCTAQKKTFCGKKKNGVGQFATLFEAGGGVRATPQAYETSPYTARVKPPIRHRQTNRERAQALEKGRRRGPSPTRFPHPADEKIQEDKARPRVHRPAVEEYAWIRSLQFTGASYDHSSWLMCSAHRTVRAEPVHGALTASGAASSLWAAPTSRSSPHSRHRLRFMPQSGGGAVGK